MSISVSAEEKAQGKRTGEWNLEFSECLPALLASLIRSDMLVNKPPFGFQTQSGHSSGNKNIIKFRASLTTPQIKVRIY